MGSALVTIVATVAIAVTDGTPTDRDGTYG
jgi:hypothetical protein